MAGSALLLQQYFLSVQSRVPPLGLHMSSWRTGMVVVVHSFLDVLTVRCQVSPGAARCASTLLNSTWHTCGGGAPEIGGEQEPC